jgi:hypothetical protein
VKGRTLFSDVLDDTFRSSADVPVAPVLVASEWGNDFPCRKSATNCENPNSDEVEFPDSDEVGIGVSMMTV